MCEDSLLLKFVNKFKMSEPFRQTEADLDGMDTQSYADNLNGEGGDDRRPVVPSSETIGSVAAHAGYPEVDGLKLQNDENLSDESVDATGEWEKYMDDEVSVSVSLDSLIAELEHGEFRHDGYIIEGGINGCNVKFSDWAGNIVRVLDPLRKAGIVNMQVRVISAHVDFGDEGIKPFNRKEAFAREFAAKKWSDEVKK